MKNISQILAESGLFLINELNIVDQGNNYTVVEIGKATVLFSYKTPVAAHIEGKGYIKSEEKYSATTSKHVSQWLTKEHAKDAMTVPQKEIDDLVG